MDIHKYSLNGCETVNDYPNNYRQDRQKPRLLQPFLVIWENILQFIAGLASSAGEIEIGGELYGLLSHAGRPVILYATPPGSGAIREKARFRQDIEFMRDANSYLRDKCGIQYIGNWHHHHHMFARPSSGDIRSTHMIAKRNQYEVMCQIILTFEKETLSDYQSDPLSNRFKARRQKSRIEQIRSEYAGFLNRKAFSMNSTPKRIRVNAFSYSDAKYGQPTRCPIKILSGISPFKYALTEMPGISEQMTCTPHPLSRITYDSSDFHSEQTAQSPELPRSIKDQCLLLPEDLKKNAEIVFKKGLALLSLPLPEKNGEIIVAYQEKNYNECTAVYLIIKKPAEKQPMNITAESLPSGPYTRLSTIYNEAVSLYETGTIVEKLKTPPTRRYFSRKRSNKTGEGEYISCHSSNYQTTEH
jgi:integrative and conjugative element protein (TIGR02256 family)